MQCNFNARSTYTAFAPCAIMHLDALLSHYQLTNFSFQDPYASTVYHIKFILLKAVLLVAKVFESPELCQ